MTLRCSVRLHAGQPTLHVAGRPVALLGYKSGPRDPETYQAFAQAGYGTAHVNVKLDEVWPSADRVDPQPLRDALAGILQVDRQAHVLLELHANAPEWWLAANPDQQQVDPSGQRYGQSMASHRWRVEAGEIVAECVRVAEAEHPDSVLIYFVGAGHTWEWFHRTPLRYVIDVSPPMLEAYRVWLHGRYPTDRDLGAAWGRGASLAQARPPAWEEIVACDVGCLRDPAARRPVIDFFEFYSALMVDALLHFGQAVKRACQGRKLFGVFYGHLLDWVDNPLTAQHSGHLCLARLLESPLVEVIAGPNSYMNRTVGRAASFTAPVDSIRLHGKLWLAETDTRTHLASRVQDGCGRPETLEASLTLLKRDFGHALVRGVGMVWFSLFGGWFDHPAIMAFMAQARRIAQASLETDRGSVAQAAAFVDERSPLALAGPGAYRVDPFISQEPRASDLLAHLGFPCDLYLLSDLPRVDAARYRLIFFLNAIWPTDDERACISERLCRDGRALVWFGTPGLVRSDVAAAHASELLGMKVRLLEPPSDAFCRILWDAHPITRRISLGDLLPTWVDGDFEGHFGTNQLLSPRLCVEDERAVPLGLYSREGAVGFAVRELPGWRSVFIGTPFAPPAVLRQIGAWAGVHVYNESDTPAAGDLEEFRRAGWNLDGAVNPADDVLYATDSFVCLHVKHPGPRRLRLPEPRRVVDVFADREVAAKSDVIRVDCDGPQTHLWYVGRRRWEEVVR